MSGIDEIRNQLVRVVERLPVDELFILGNQFNECLLDLTHVSDGSEELKKIRAYLANTVGQALTDAEDRLREGRDNLSLYAAML